MNTRRVASVDIGSNSLLLLVAEQRADGSWRRVADFLDITRIAEGLDSSGRLAREPVRRTADALARFVEDARTQWGVGEVFITGTAPFRRASNGPAVAEQLARRVHAPMRVVSGDEEAQLVRLASRRAFPDLCPMVLIDVGGASTEVVIDDAEGQRFVSFDVGSVRLFERIEREDTSLRTYADRANAGTTRRHAAERAARQALEPLDGWATSQRTMIGIAGTVTALAMMHLKLVDWDHDAVHGTELPRDAVSALVDELFAMDVEQRREHPSIEAKRADVLPYGAIVLLTAMNLLGVDAVRVSDHGIRWGRLIQETSCTHQ